MFNSILDARTFLTNHGFFDAVDFYSLDLIINELYRNADSIDDANSIIERFI